MERILFVVMLLCHVLVHGQSEKLEKMKEVSFMTGHWVGTSKTIKNGKSTGEVPAYQEISYGLDGHILVIELKSTTLQLHTIIMFDESKGHYVYHPYSKKGMRALPAQLEEGKFIVNANDSLRFVFSKTEEGGLIEYGERLVEGEWQRYFEDVFWK